MKTNQIRRAIDAHLSGLKLSQEDMARIRLRAMQNSERITGFNMRRLVFAVICALTLAALLASGVGVPVRNLETFHQDDNYTMAVSSTEDTPEYSEKITVHENIRNTWGDEVADYLAETGAYINLPAWIPDSFYLTDTAVYSDESGNASCLAFYLNAENASMDLQIDVMPAVEDHTMYFSIHSDGGKTETWHIGGMEYHYEETQHFSYVVWMENNCIAVISSETGRDDLRKMIESILPEGE